MEASCQRSIFVIHKKGKTTQREVWNGSLITEAAAHPYFPPRLANPAALTDLEASSDRPLWVSGRDAKVFFDQLRAPSDLIPFFGRPAVEMRELCDIEGGLTSDEMEGFVLDPEYQRPDGIVTPVNRVWPMGFGWSSFVAQSFMVDCCFSAGFDTQCLLTEEGSLCPVGSLGSVGSLGWLG